jgi:hypothetical protein
MELRHKHELINMELSHKHYFNLCRYAAVRVSDAVEAFLAPALLPRGSLNHQVLLAIRGGALQVESS